MIVICKETKTEARKLFEELGYWDGYLKSEHWKMVKKFILERDNKRCRLCSSENELEVHHTTYEKHINEPYNTKYATLCRNCHENIHRLLDEQIEFDLKIKDKEIGFFKIKSLLNLYKIKLTQKRYINIKIPMKAVGVIRGVLIEYTDKDLDTIFKKVMNNFRLKEALWIGGVHYKENSFYKTYSEQEIKLWIEKIIFNLRKENKKNFEEIIRELSEFE